MFIELLDVLKRNESYKKLYTYRQYKSILNIKKDVSDPIN